LRRARISRYFLGLELEYIYMPAASPKRQPDPAEAEHHRTPKVGTLEATGLLIIAVLVLVLTLIRHWHNIHWSLR